MEGAEPEGEGGSKGEGGRDASRRFEKELAEKGLSRDEIKSLEAVVYGRADEIMEGPVARAEGLVTDEMPGGRFPPRRDTDFIDGISGEPRRNLSATGREETGMEKPTYKEGERIYDLTDVIEEPPLKIDRGDPATTAKEQTAGEALGEVLFPKDRKVYDLTNLFDENQEVQIREEIRRKAVEIAERVAREVMPGIVERVIREEIEKLKKA